MPGSLGETGDIASFSYNSSADGRYAVFGYTIEGQDALDKMGRQGGKILSAQVIDGLDNLVEPKA